MNTPNRPVRNSLVFTAAIQKKGWFKAHRYLLLRRFCQVFVLILFTFPVTIGLNTQKHDAADPFLGSAYRDLSYTQGEMNEAFWLIKGTLANSELLHIIPLGDPFVFVQSVAAGNAYTARGFLGVIIIAMVYVLFGGRTYCAFICPVNIITDLASWIRRQLRITNQRLLSRQARFYLLGLIIVLSFITKTIVWELVNPVTGLFRVLVFGGLTLANFGVVSVCVIFILDIIAVHHLWCGHVCPVGAVYGLLGKKTPLRIKASQIQSCDACMDCYKACPEPHVLKPIIQGQQYFADHGLSPSVISGDCTRCGRCLDVCPESVFRYDWSISQQESKGRGNGKIK